MSTTDAPVDIDVLRGEIQKTYTEVSTEQDRDFIFPTGRAWAQDLGYPEPELSRVPDPSAESFAGVANHFLLGRLEPGQTVVDLGCGAGTDLLIAAQMVGPEGRAIGIDMTPAMLDRARESADAMGLENVELHQGLIESLPLEDGSVDDRLGRRQGRCLRRDRPRAQAERAPADRRRRHPQGGLRGRAQAHRPLDRLNCRRAPVRGARAAVGRAGLQGHPAGRARRHLRALGVRGHAPQGREVRRHGLDDPRHQAEPIEEELLWRASRSRTSTPRTRHGPSRARARPTSSTSADR
ncbi:MAG: methyltransferase domain-containing protein [Actinobacteria bacterium]|nr:MAG: methyltransferase domain-containing protein [Actinomycetota bacterium]